MTKQFYDLTPKPADRMDEIEDTQAIILCKLDTIILMLGEILQRNKITN